MNAEELRYKAEQHAIAICLSWAGLCLGLGLTIQAVGRAIDRATGLGGDR